MVDKKEEYRMYNEFPIPHRVFEDDKFMNMKISSRLLYCYLAKMKNRWGKGKSFFRSEQDLAEDTGMNIKTIKAAKKELRGRGYIEIERGKNVHSGYRGPDYFKVKGYFADDPDYYDFA